MLELKPGNFELKFIGMMQDGDQKFLSHIMKTKNRSLINDYFAAFCLAVLLFLYNQNPPLCIIFCYY